MSFAAALDALGEAAIADHVGSRASTRIADVQELVAGDLLHVEELLRQHVAAGISPGNDAGLHLYGAGGKRIRPVALLLSATCFGAITDQARQLAACAELVHMATLLHDDVIDDADQRRGITASRRVWGNAVSVLAGDSLLIEALRLASCAEAPTWHELLSTLRSLVDAEVIQLRGRRILSLHEPTYFDVVRGKTASLFEWAMRAGARSARATPEGIDACGSFGRHVGVAFQLVDDVLDYDGDEASTGKAVFADLTEGKVTLPLIRAAALGNDCMDLIDRVRRGDDEAAARLAARVRASGACENVRTLALHETDLALAHLDRIPPSDARDVLANVARELACRVR